MDLISKTGVTLLLWTLFLLRLALLLRTATTGIRNAHSIDQQASRFRWTGFALGALLFWVAAERKALYYHSYFQLGTLLIGLLLLGLFGLVPDTAYYLARGVNDLRHIPNPPDPLERKD